MSEGKFNLAWVASVTGGWLENTKKDMEGFSRVVIDSREDVRGALFVALKGERFDGHRFVDAAIEAGASAVMVDESNAGADLPRIVVKDTLAGLQDLAAAHRGRFRGKLAGITGSSGKTTTRRILTSVLSQSRVTHEPRKNFNNHIGVPLTLLELNDQMEAAVLELGCSDFGEIAELTRLANPDVALVTNVGPAHLEKLIDLEGVARAKGELFAGLGSDSIAVINLDDSRVALMETAACTRMTYGTSKDADVRLVSRSVEHDGTQSVHMSVRGVSVSATLPLLGVHNAQNAVAATAAACAMSASLDDIQYGLATVPATPGRLEVSKGPAGSTIIDDTYNANPASMAAALEVLAEFPGDTARIAVLSDMLELGGSSWSAHMDLGRKAAGLGLKLLVTMGERGAQICDGALEAGMSKQTCRHVKSHEEAARVASEMLQTGDALLIKGSRGTRMEEVVKLLT